MERARRLVDEGVPVAPAVGRVVVRHELLGRLDRAERVAQVSGPAGSGKTVLLRSWLNAAGLGGRTAWVSVPEGERDPQRFWVAVADALRGTAPGAGVLRPLTAAPDLDGWAVVERLLADVSRLPKRIWLVIDDLHELAAEEARHQLELLILRAPEKLRFVLAGRHELGLGLHRLRLEGALTEIRGSELRMTLPEVRGLFAAADIAVPDAVLEALHERTEGWAAGLRLAALSLAGHPDPERFASEFSGSERAVADYLMAEVLKRQSGPVRHLLLSTSLLERVCGELGELLAGQPGAERALQDLERAGAFTASLNAQRSWFRYHPLFADLLRLELRRTTAPAEVALLHRTASAWFAEHQFPVEAVRHVQAAGDWGAAARLLSDYWVDLYLGGQAATARELLTEFPLGMVSADPELTTLTALGELSLGAPQEAEPYLAQAAKGLDDRGEPVPPERRGRLRVLLCVARLQMAQERVDLRVIAEEADRLLGPAAGELPGISPDLRALAAINLGNAETWAWRAVEEADRRLSQGVALARRIGRPYLELLGLAYSARMAPWRSLVLTEERSRQAISLAERNGWSEDHATAIAYTMLGTALTGQGRPAEAAPWLDRAGQTLRAEAHPATRMNLHYARGLTAMAGRRHADAIADFLVGERLTRELVSPRALARPLRALMLLCHVHLGDLAQVAAALGRLDEEESQGTHMRAVLAALRLAQGDPEGTVAALAPTLAGPVDRNQVQASWLVEALLLESAAHDALGNADAAWHSVERALATAEPERALVPFLLQPVPKLLMRHARQSTAHPALVGDILALLREAHQDAGPAAPGWAGAAPAPGRLIEPLSQAEIRVLRYLPTGLTVNEIAGQMYLSANTVRTHLRHLYAKLAVHRRHEAVDRGRALGLLAPSVR